MFLLNGCGISLICEKGPSMLYWVGYIIERGGVPSIKALLWCPECGAEYSADVGDYWNKEPGEIFQCCDSPMKLMEKIVTYREVR